VTNPLIRCSETFSNPVALLAACEQRGLEGILPKRADAPPPAGKTKDWVKVKCASWREANKHRHELFKKHK